LIKKNTPP